MRKNVMMLLVAILCGAVGTGLLVRVVRNAETAAMAPEEQVEVFVLTRDIPLGTTAETVSLSVERVLINADLAAPGAVDQLEDIAGLVTSVDLVTGEQLLDVRFVSPEDGDVLGTDALDPGFIELTFPVDPARVLGGEVSAGDQLAIFASFQFGPSSLEDEAALDAALAGTEEIPPPVDPAAPPSDTLALTTDEPTAETSDVDGEKATHLLLHKVLVTQVQVSELAEVPTFVTTDDDDDEENGPDSEPAPILAPSGELLITVALSPADAERLIFSAEFGTLWLAREGPSVPESGTTIQTRDSVYIDPLELADDGSGS